MRNIIWYLWTHTHPEKYQRPYRTKISILQKMRANIVAIFHFYGSRAIFLLICDHQDNESEAREMEIGVAGPMFTNKKRKTLWDNPYSMRW